MDPATKAQFALEKAKYQAQLELKKEMHKGNDGYTPVKGKDYFTEREIAEIRRDIQAMLRVPKDGKDAVVDYDKILRYTYAKVAEHVAAIPRPKGIKGDKGDKGETPVLDLDDMVRRVITQLPKQKDNKFVIDRKQIEDLIDARVKTAPQQIVRLGASVASIRALTDVNLDGLAQDAQGNYILGGGTASNITGLISAGTNVTVTGTGTLADPYVISASGTGGSGITRSINNITGNTTADAAASTDYEYNCTGTVVLTLPTAVGNTNLYTITRVSGDVSIACTGGQTIQGSSTAALTINGMSLTVSSNGTNWTIK